MIYLWTQRCIASTQLQDWKTKMTQLEISQFTSKWFVEKMMEPLEIRNFSTQNGLVSNAMLDLVYPLTSLFVFHAHQIASLAIWHEMTHALSLKENLHLRTAIIISAKPQENVLQVVEVLHKPHKSSRGYSIASLQMKRKQIPMFVLTQQFTLCLMAKIISSSY